MNAPLNAVLDSSVVVAGLGWRDGPARQVLVWLAAALGAHAGWLVTYDKDLLSLRRPFGIRMVAPGEFLEQLASA